MLPTNVTTWASSVFWGLAVLVSIQYFLQYTTKRIKEDAEDFIIHRGNIDQYIQSRKFRLYSFGLVVVMFGFYAYIAFLLFELTARVLTYLNPKLWNSIENWIVDHIV